MSTTVLPQIGHSPEAPTVVRDAKRGTIPPITLGSVVGVEPRKMFDTRSGFWLMMSIAILSVVATGATILFAPDDALTYGNFAAAIGFPMAVVLPIIAILSITSEWSQRTGLTTFTLVPSRGRVILAKAISTLGIAVVSMVIAGVVGALGNVVGTAIAGVDTTWDFGVSDFLYVTLGNIIGMAIGFMLGVLIRNSAGAIVGYFVYSLLLPTITGVLAASQEWFRDAQPWVDFNYNANRLFEGGFVGEDWAQLAVTGAVWLALPLAIGLRLVMRSEVK
jgi:ABC-2 type transport system permease protein